MCGIGGLLFAERRAEAATIGRMCAAIVHRGPDDSGTFVDENVALGHRRLSIIDIRSGHQPMSSADGRATIVFNGEIYNYRSLREQLVKRGYTFTTNSDTEVILALYLCHGSSCVELLRGMFAFAIWDRQEKSLFAATDRVGKKPLYYSFDAKRCIWGSELKAVLAAEEFVPELDPQAVDDFFAYGFVRAPRSIYRQVAKLEPGHTLVVRRDRSGGLECNTRRYWQFPARSPDHSISYEDAKAELVRLLREAVKLRLMSEVPLGAFLSGGIDSSTVVWLMSEVSEQPVNTFSIGFDDERFSELPFARAVADRFGTRHEEETVTADAAKVLPDVISAFDEPFGDPSAVPTWYVSLIARKHVTVALSGDGGDEVFAGYSRYVTIAEEWARWGRVPRLLRHGVASARYLLPLETRSWNKLRRLSLAPRDGYSLFRTNFSVPMREKLFAPNFLEQIQTDLTANVFGAISELCSDDDVLSLVMASDYTAYLPHDVLVKVDRMSMAHSLEVRSPMLDHEMAEFAQRLPTDFLYSGGRGKRILRDCVEPYLPANVLTHRKQGFSVPLKSWFREGLKPLLDEALESDVYRHSGMFRPEYVRHIHRLHEAGRADLSWQLWQLLIFSMWYAKRQG